MAGDNRLVTEDFLRLNFTPKSGITPGTDNSIIMDYVHIRTRYLVSISGVQDDKRCPGQNQIAPEFTVGQSYGGGIVAHIFTSGESGYVPGYISGFICAVADQSSACAWGTTTATVSTTQGVFGAVTNTNNIITVNGAGSYAAQLCANYSTTVNSITYSDWYLPTYDELIYIHANKTAIGGFGGGNYWSSTQSLATTVQAYIIAFASGVGGDANKLFGLIACRAIRYFSVPM